MFSDAALYERVLSACPESLRDGFLFGTDDQALPKCLGGFNELIGRDLGDAERAITGRLATLSVNNWAEDAPDTSSEEEPGETTPDEDGGEKESPVPMISSLQEEPPSEPKLTPEEVVSLLEDEFGALAPPGEEKLLLEADAAFFRDVVVLVSATRYISRAGLRFSAMVRVLFTSLRIVSHFTLRSYPPSKITIRKS
jgi:sterol 3beta-glucosyltransferase